MPQFKALRHQGTKASIPTKCADLSRSAGLACLGCRSTLDYLLDLTQGDPHLGGPADLVGVLEIIYKGVVSLIQLDLTDDWNCSPLHIL